MNQGGFKILGRDPAAILYTLQALLAVAVSLHMFGLTGQSADWVMTIANGVMAAVVAVCTRPFVVAALTGGVQTILTGVAAFGIEGFTPTQEQQGVLIAALSAVLALVLRMNQEPKETVLTRA